MKDQNLTSVKIELWLIRAILYALTWILVFNFFVLFVLLGTCKDT